MEKKKKRIKGVVAIALSVMLTGIFCSCGSTGSSSSVAGTTNQTTSSTSRTIENKEANEAIENSSTLNGISVGDIVKFGAYEQDNNPSNGKEKIEWVVLEKENDRILIISKYVLDCQPFNTSFTGVTWENCSLRKWLNGTFVSNAFSADEQNIIQKTSVTADENPAWDTWPGNKTTDKVFLLSMQEANKYFSSDEARRCAPTDYAIAQGVFIDEIGYSVDGRTTGSWWQRSPGFTLCYATCVHDDGSVRAYGDDIDHGGIGVRPALWINLGSEATENKETNNSSALKGASVGDIVKFGSFEQDNDSSDGKEEIEWVVLAKEGDNALVISKYALDYQLYNTVSGNVTWETCSLRQWLNETFINNAFSSDEQNMIQTTTVTADKDSEAFNTSPGNNTTDKVFLLSITEVKKYFSSDEARRCAPTEYARAHGAGTSPSYSVDGIGTCWWWLRSPGYNSEYAAVVCLDGKVGYYGQDVQNNITAGICFRPALWINLGSEANENKEDKEVIENKQAKDLIENTNTLKGSSVGDIVKFGAYEQDNNSSNGKEEIEWIVLAKEGDKALIISKNILDTAPYEPNSTSSIAVTWETCSLRKWLNETFISNAFSLGEQNMIQTTTVTADKNPNYDTSPGNNTTDKVFLLNIQEVNKYFSTNEARKCAPTEYARAQGAHTRDDSVDGEAIGDWWLRSPGISYNNNAYVVDFGSVNDIGCFVGIKGLGVRPAMWINIGS